MLSRTQLNRPTSPLHSTSQPQDLRRTSHADEHRTDFMGTASMGETAHAAPHPPMTGDPFTPGRQGPTAQGAMRKPTYEELRKLAAMYEPPRKPRRSAAAVAMVTVFLVGATAGLGGAWWMTNKNQQQTPAIAAQGSHSDSARRQAENSRPLSVDGDRTASAARGLNPAELPFDGKKQASGLPKREPAPAITPDELPYGGQSSGSGIRPGTMAAGAGEPESTVTGRYPAIADGAGKSIPGVTGEANNIDNSAALTLPAAPPAAASPASAASSMASTMTIPPVAKADEKPASKERDIAGAIKSDKEIDRAGNNPSSQAALPVAPKEAVKPKPKRQPDSRELDRIRQQAAEELRRKNEAKRIPNEARANQGSQRVTKARVAASSPSSESRTRLVRGQLAACENAGNFLLREQCKWQLCSGKWGKNGCPSYSTSHSAAY